MVQSVRVEKYWHRLMAKSVLRVTGKEAKAVCGTEQLTGGVEAGIEGGLQTMRLLWAQHSQEEDWGFLLIYVWNAFNEKNRTAVLWAVCHEWPSGAQFTFNCYHHLATIVVQNLKDGSGHFLYRK